MATLTFKNVGQGDSIILEWEFEAHKYVGIIDCNKTPKSNPVLEHIKSNSIKEIAFIVASHPHRDHYSGFCELFEYCEKEGVTIGWFGHTAFTVGEEYWIHYEEDRASKAILAKFLKAITSLKTAGIIKKMYGFNDSTEKTLPGGIHLKLLSPSEDEFLAFYRKCLFKPSENRDKVGKAANLLSTVFLFTTPQSRFLLTSDAEATTFERIDKEGELRLLQLKLIQAPHHGSEVNYFHAFWQNLLSCTNRRAVISSGSHRSYEHPSYSVVDKLDSLGYSIHATNIIYGMAQYVSVQHKRALLGLVSNLIDAKGGDKSFSV